MSMLCYTLIIAFLIGIRAAPKSEDNVPLGSPATSDTGFAQTHEGLKTSQNTDQRHPAPKKAEDQELGSAANIIVDSKLFQKRRFQSPRVLFSTQPPPLSRDEQSVEFLNNEDALNRNIWAKRQNHPVHDIQHAVCESISAWVSDKTTATDINGRTVTVVAEINHNNNFYKQYFFETKCNNPNPVPSECRGIDSRQWNSYCTTTDTFVNALTMEGNKASWRFIRINTACVCVISKPNVNF
uniref:Nerve growth factor n=1 Tax=Calliophis bivirgatus TaxID=8633 RepID=A0A898ILA7_CALBG|nr:nerve growth factor [Calliophis bivirgatus]